MQCPPEVFQPLVRDLFECSNQQYSKSILGRIANNIASRSPEEAKEILKFCLDHKLLEKIMKRLMSMNWYPTTMRQMTTTLRF